MKQQQLTLRALQYMWGMHAEGIMEVIHLLEQILVKSGIEDRPVCLEPGGVDA